MGEKLTRSAFLLSGGGPTEIAIEEHGPPARPLTRSLNSPLDCGCGAATCGPMSFRRVVPG
jgi:hypothetical protein